MAYNTWSLAHPERRVPDDASRHASAALGASIDISEGFDSRAGGALVAPNSDHSRDFLDELTHGEHAVLLVIHWGAGMELRVYGSLGESR